MPAGDRKMPLPIVEPISTAIALKSPSWRGSDDGGLETSLCAIGRDGVVMAAMLQPQTPLRTGCRRDCSLHEVGQRTACVDARSLLVRLFEPAIF